MTKHINLLIATPGHSLMSSYVKSLLKTIPVLEENQITWTFLNEYASNVADAREVTLSSDFSNDINNSSPMRGTYTYDKILWIDSDIAWEPEDVLKLYYSDKDMISGAYLLADGTVVAYPKLGAPGLKYDQVKDMSDIVPIEGCGFGFLCMKSGIFESFSRPWFQQTKIEVDFGNGNTVVPLMGEDLSLCKRAMDNGFEIWFDPTVRVQHHKVMKLTWEGIIP